MPINALDIGMIPDDDTFDNGPILNAFLQGDDVCLFVPKGNYTFKTQMDPVTKVKHIQGVSLSHTVFIREHVGDFLRINSGFGHVLRDFGIVTASPAGAGGMAINFKALATMDSPDYSSLENILVTAWSGSSWSIGIALDGVDRVDSSPSGIRDMNLSNCFIFGCNTFTLYCNTLHGANLNLQVFPAGGLTNKIQFNAWGHNPCSGIILTAPVLTDVDIWNVRDSVFTAPAYGVISQINTTNVRLL